MRSCVPCLDCTASGSRHCSPGTHGFLLANSFQSSLVKLNGEEQKAVDPLSSCSSCSTLTRRNSPPRSSTSSAVCTIEPLRCLTMKVSVDLCLVPFILSC